MKRASTHQGPCPRCKKVVSLNARGFTAFHKYTARDGFRAACAGGIVPPKDRVTIWPEGAEVTE